MYDAMMAETISITGHGGDRVEAYLARPLAPGPCGGVVVITARANEELFEASERARRRRGWVVGEAVIDADIPLQRVGIEWPLQ